jgi:hypothetical protein
MLSVYPPLLTLYICKRTASRLSRFASLDRRIDLTEYLDAVNKIKCLPLPEIEPRRLGLPVRSLVNTPADYPDYLHINVILPTS